MDFAFIGNLIAEIPRRRVLADAHREFIGLALSLGVERGAVRPRVGAMTFYELYCNWTADRLSIGDVASPTASELPAVADLAWASHPCQAVSLPAIGRFPPGTFGREIRA
jgi:hypothetical protein